MENPESYESSQDITEQEVEEQTYKELYILRKNVLDGQNVLEKPNDKPYVLNWEEKGPIPTYILDKSQDHISTSIEAWKNDKQYRELGSIEKQLFEKITNKDLVQEFMYDTATEKLDSKKIKIVGEKFVDKIVANIEKLSRIERKALSAGLLFVDDEGLGSFFTTDFAMSILDIVGEAIARTGLCLISDEKNPGKSVKAESWDVYSYSTIENNVAELTGYLSKNTVDILRKIHKVL